MFSSKNVRIRSFRPYDFEWVKKVHEKHFQEEFELPEFDNKYHGVFTLEDDSGIITVGGVRPLAELVAITDKDKSARQRVAALKILVEAGMFTCGVNNYDQLHCFVQGEKWIRQIQTVHFRPTKGQSLVLDIG